MRMSTALNRVQLGALSSTGRYTLPTDADKKDTYRCLECNDPVFVKQGSIRSHHFCHYHDNCSYYQHASESDIHKNAKLRIKQLLEDRVEVSIQRKCIRCEDVEQMDIPLTSNTSRIINEFAFLFEESMEKGVADVAYLEGDSFVAMIEIYHTHLTEPSRRVEPWFEVAGKEVLTTPVQDNKAIFKCIRKERCDECNEKHNKERYDKIIGDWYNIIVPKQDIEFYVRYSLGQRQFTPSYEYNPNPDKMGHFTKIRLEHQRISFHEQDEHNDRIAALFEDKFRDIKMVIRGYKGSVSIGFIHSSDTFVYTKEYMSSHQYCTEHSGVGTVSILMHSVYNNFNQNMTRHNQKARKK